MAEDIREMTVDEALEIYENSALNVAFQIGVVSNGGREEFDSREDMGRALAKGVDAVDSFRDYILSHSKHHCEASRGLQMAACTMLWMSRVHTFLLDGEDDKDKRFPEGPKSFIDHVTAYSVLTEQDWGAACEEVLASEEA